MGALVTNTNLRLFNSSFNNLQLGVTLDNISHQFMIDSISQCSFSNNIHAVVTKNDDRIRILENTIWVPESKENQAYWTSMPQFAYLNNPIGISVENCNNYIVYDNNIDGNNLKDANTTCSNCNIGVLVDHTDRAGFVHQNSFSTLNVGVQVQNENSGSYQIFTQAGPTGLEMYCNEFTSNANYDIVLVDNPNGNPSTLSNQGFCEHFPALNTFSNCNNTTNLAALTNLLGGSSGNSFEYAHYDPNNGSLPCDINVQVNSCNGPMKACLTCPETDDAEVVCSGYFSLFEISAELRSVEDQGDEYLVLRNRQDELLNRLDELTPLEIAELEDLRFRKALVFNSLIPYFDESVNAIQVKNLAYTDRDYSVTASLVKYIQQTQDEQAVLDFLSTHDLPINLSYNKTHDYLLFTLNLISSEALLQAYPNERWSVNLSGEYTYYTPQPFPHSIASLKQNIPLPVNKEQSTTEQAQIKAIPNPSSGRFTLIPSLYNGTYKYEIVDMRGSLVHSGAGTGASDIDFTKKGTYFIRVYYNDSLAPDVLKIIVK